MQTWYFKMVDLMEAINVGAYLLSSGFTILFFLCRYNKRDFDFPSLREYNDYLELVEDIGRTHLMLTCLDCCQPSIDF